MSDFGRLIGITARNVYKSFATDVEVQIKIACSLIDGSQYVVPTLLRSDVPDVAGTGDLDIAVEDALAVLVVDGQHHDGVNYNNVKNDHTGQCRLKFKDGTTKIEFAAYPKFTTFKPVAGKTGTFTGEMYPIAGHYSVPFPSSKVYDLYQAKSVYPSVGARYGEKDRIKSAHWEAWMNVYMHGDRTIKLTNLEIVPHTQGGRYVMALVDGVTIINTREEFAGQCNGKGKYTIDSYDPSIVDIDNHGHFYLGTFRSRYAAENDAFTPIASMKDRRFQYAYRPPSKNGVSTEFEITGIPVGSTTAQIGGVVPARFWNWKVTDSSSIIPSVTKNQAAHSMIPSVEHQKAVSFAVASCRAHKMKSVVTTLTDRSGVVVAEVVRHSQGMYIHRDGIPRYGRCVQTIDGLRGQCNGMVTTQQTTVY